MTRLTMVIPPEAKDSVNASLVERFGHAAENTFQAEVYDDDGNVIGYICSWDVSATGFSDDDVSTIKNSVEKLGQDVFDEKEPEIGKEALKLTVEKSAQLATYVSIAEGEIAPAEREVWLEERKISLKEKEALIEEPKEEIIKEAEIIEDVPIKGK